MEKQVTIQVDAAGCEKDRVTVQVLRRVDGGYIVRLTRFCGKVESSRSDYPVEEDEGGLREATELAKSILNFAEMGLPLSALLPEQNTP